MSSTTPEHGAHASHNIVSHIRDLLPLPKHAVFHVRLVIHELQSVPLISGQFRIKWKFRHLQAVNSAGRPLGLGRALALKLEKRHVEPSGKGKGKGKEKELVKPVILLPEDENDPQRPSIPGCDTPIQSINRAESTYSGQSSSISNPNSKPSSSNIPPASEVSAIDFRPEARGHTQFLPLQDFKVVFEQQVDVAVQMSVEKDSLALLQSALKLTVMQRVIPGDPEAPLNPRLGHVEVNLAEYADAGSVTRNYLLRRSKVNAMLNMTITMTQISGVENYHAPSLRKEEIGAGIATFLSSSTPLPALQRFMSPEDPWLSDSLPHFLPQEEIEPDPPEKPPFADDVDDQVPHETRGKKRWRVGGNGKHTKSGGSRKATEPQLPPKPATPQKEGLHPTEALIEAIFNPVPTTSTALSPFTYYVPPAPPQSQQVSDSPGTEGTSRGSFDSSRQASASDQGNDGGVENRSGRRKWWRRKTDHGSVTPARSNSTRS